MACIYYRLLPPQPYRRPTRWAAIPQAEAATVKQGEAWVAEHMPVLCRIARTSQMTRCVSRVHRASD